MALVHRAPPDRIPGFVVNHDIFILRCPSGKITCIHHEGTTVSQDPFTLPEGFFIQFSRGIIPMDPAGFETK
jgi:hypothetical protein